MFDAGVDPNDPNAGGMHGGFSGGFGDMGDIFNMFTGGAFGGGNGGPTPRTQPGHDALATVTIDLKTAVFGDTAHVEIKTFGLCQECAGTGCQKGTPAGTVPRLPWSGLRTARGAHRSGQMMTTAPCERCEGHGTVIENPCPSCLGHGRVRITRNVGVSVPAGVTNNTRLRLANQGGVGENGGVAGDLYRHPHRSG